MRNISLLVGSITQAVDVAIIHLGGLTLDLFGGWLLLFPKTRLFAIVLLSKFHLMNAFIFEIGRDTYSVRWFAACSRTSVLQITLQHPSFLGMFPYVMLVTSAIFCEPHWPKILTAGLRKLTNTLGRRLNFSAKPQDTIDSSLLNPTPPDSQSSSDVSSVSPDLLASSDSCQPSPSSVSPDCLASSDLSVSPDCIASSDSCQPSPDCLYPSNPVKTRRSFLTSLSSPSHLRESPSRGHKRTVVLVLLYAAFQCFLPWSHFLTRGSYWPLFKTLAIFTVRYLNPAFLKSGRLQPLDRGPLRVFLGYDGPDLVDATYPGQVRQRVVGRNGIPQSGGDDCRHGAAVELTSRHDQTIRTLRRNQVVRVGNA